MRKIILVSAIAASVLLVVVPSFAQTQDDVWSQIAELPWQTYPAVGEIGTVADIKLSDKLYYLGEVGTKTFLRLNGNPEYENAYTIMPEDGSWFAILSYEDSGHVKDDDVIDPDTLLATLKEQNASSKAERKSQGLPILVLDDWAIEPHYDASSKRLEWGTKLHEEGTSEITANYTARILGRTGLTQATLVSDPMTLNQNVQAFHKALAGFSYDAGQSYGEYRQGDKLAEYGLVALIAGGAAAVATKSGFLKGIGMAVVAGVVAIGGAIVAFFKKLFRRKPS